MGNLNCFISMIKINIHIIHENAIAAYKMDFYNLSNIPASDLANAEKVLFLWWSGRIAMY